MDPESLHTASKYVNNLLLSRGLLRNGVPIEFAKPKAGPGARDATMASIINLVHDLVLRRDQETDHVTSLSQDMQALRATSAQQTRQAAGLETKSAELERQLALSVAREQTAKRSLRSAETANKVLREETSKLKTTVSQIRAQCANEVRKRDQEMQRLKKHLESSRRGREGSGQVGVTVVAADVSGSKGAPSRTGNGLAYSLKEETGEHLTQLSRSLAAENQTLNTLLHSTLSTLRQLQGLPAEDVEDAPPAPTSHGATEFPATVEVTAAAISADCLGARMSSVLGHLHGLLTNPSFVPLEEVEVRDEEIGRLRAGWEKMEARWREAVGMMNGWRDRMLETGDTVELEDLRQGLSLGADAMMVESARQQHRQQEGEVEDEDEEGEGWKEEEEKEDGSGEADKMFGTDPEGETEAAAREAPGMGRTSLFPAPDMLRPTDTGGNKRRATSPRKVAFSLTNTDLDRSPDRSIRPPWKKARRNYTAAAAEEEHENEDEDRDTENAPPSPSPSPSPSLTVREKLELAEREAEEAAMRKTTTMAKTKGTAIPRRVLRRAKRRSTLSVDELDGLLLGGGT